MFSSVMDAVVELPFAIFDGLTHLATTLATMSLAHLFAVGCLVPMFVVFMMLVCPLKVFRELGLFIVRILGTPIRLPIVGASREYSFLLVLALALLGVSVLEWIEWYVRFIASSPTDVGNLGVDMELKGKRWRCERTVYMCGCATVLAFALQRIAALTHELRQSKATQSK